MSLYNTSKSEIHVLTLNPVKFFTRRSLIPEEIDSLWKIETGFVRTFTYLEDGTTVALGIWGHGDVVGQPLSKLDPYQIECLTPVTATMVSLINWDLMTDILLSHIQQAEELTVIRGYKRVEMMLVKLLMWLSKKIWF